MLSKDASLLAGVGIVALLWGASPALAQTAGAAESFAIVGGQAVNANGTGSTVDGDVGINPAAATFITGFPANATITPPFSNHGNDAVAISASAASLTLFNSPEMAPAGGLVIGADLSISGPTADGVYPPGKYFVETGTALLPNDSFMTLRGAGTYVFTVNSDLTANTGSSIVLEEGADACDVWWRVPTQATLNGGSFVGTIVSNALIALGSSATLTGRALNTANGSVTLAGFNTIGGCSVPLVVVPTLPQVFMLLLALGLTAAGYLRLRRRAQTE